MIKRRARPPPISLSCIRISRHRDSARRAEPFFVALADAYDGYDLQRSGDDGTGVRGPPPEVLQAEISRTMIVSRVTGAVILDVGWLGGFFER